MKRILALSLAAAFSLSLLAGCGGTPAAEPSSGEGEPLITGSAEHLHVLLPYGTSENVLAEQGDAFCAALRDEMANQGWEIGEVTVDAAETIAASGKALDDGTADVAVLAASQYFTYSDDAVLLMTATKPGLSVSSENAADWNGSAAAPQYTDEDCPYGRTLICTTMTEKGRALAQAAKNGTLSWEQLADARWLYPKASTSSDFMYADLWLSRAFGKTMSDLSDVLPVDGYGALFAEAVRGEADVIVLSADKRIDYADAWQLGTDEIDSTGKMGLGRQDSIFNEISVIGVTEPIYGDVMALRTDETPFADADFQTALIAAMKALQKNDAARALWESCGYTGFAVSGDSHYDNIRDLIVFGTGD